MEDIFERLHEENQQVSLFLKLKRDPQARRARQRQRERGHGVSGGGTRPEWCQQRTVEATSGASSQHDLPGVMWRLRQCSPSDQCLLGEHPTRTILRTSASCCATSIQHAPSNTSLSPMTLLVPICLALWAPSSCSESQDAHRPCAPGGVVGRESPRRAKGWEGCMGQFKLKPLSHPEPGQWQRPSFLSCSQ